MFSGLYCEIVNMQFVFIYLYTQSMMIYSYLCSRCDRTLCIISEKGHNYL